MPKTLVTPSVFKAVKILIDAGETHKKIAEYMQLSMVTISRISCSETYEEYQNVVVSKNGYVKKAIREKEAAEKTEVKPQPQSTVVQVPYYVVQKLDKIIDLLTAISNKAAFIVEDLTK